MYNQHQQYHYTLVTIDTKLVGVNTPPRKYNAHSTYSVEQGGGRDTKFPNT